MCIIESLDGSDHLNGTYGLPSGKTEPGETLVQAAMRELKEETGLQTIEEQLFPIGKFYAEIQQKGGVKRFDWYIYLCTEYSGVLKGSNETLPQWVEISEVGNLGNLLPNIEKAIFLATQKRSEK